MEQTTTTIVHPAKRSAVAVQQLESFGEIAVPAAPIDEPGCWMGRDLQASGEWQYRLSGTDIAELEAALARTRKLGLELLQIRTMSDFPLGRLAEKLADFRREILFGRGFVLLRGLPVARYSKLDAATIYWGIGLHLGYPVVQNGKGHMLGHVVDLGSSSDESATLPDGTRRPFINAEIRGYNSRERFYFHVDNADMVGLLCLHPARQGGQSLIASSVAIHNEVMRRRPDLLEVLYQPMFVSRQGEVPAGAKPYYPMPVFMIHEGHFSAAYWRAFVENCRIFPEVPPVTAQQLEAFALIDSIADDPAFHISMDLQQGDMQFINNHVVVHTRTAFEDFPEPERKRYLLRLWLVAPEGRPLSHWFYDYYGAGRRGGIYVPGVVESASLEP